MSELSKYVDAFGDVQAEWINSVLLSELSALDRFVLLGDLLPGLIQRWYGRMRHVAIIRSLIPGGHRLVVCKGGAFVGVADFKLTNDGWIRQKGAK